MQPVITAISSGLDLRCSIVSRESGGKKKIVPHSRRKKNGKGARGETRKGETEREMGPSLEKKTFLEPWINTAVVKSEEHADGRRRREREREGEGRSGDRSSPAGRTIGAPRSVADKQIAN